MQLVVLVVSGCGGKEDIPEVYSNLQLTSGEVSLDGKPLQGATVIFIPVGQNAVRRAIGVTDEAGKYELVTHVSGRSAEQNKGAVPGKYKVIITKILTKNGTAVPEGMTDADAMAEGAKESIPTRYSSEGRSKLSAEVKEAAGEGENIFDFDVKSR